jgi:TolA-binding protein
MRTVIRLIGLVLLVSLASGASLRALAQATVSESDIKRLQLAVSDARQDVAHLKTRDAAKAATLEKELEQLADEVTYLRVKITKEGSASRSEYSSLRDRIDDLRSRAGASSASGRVEGATGVTVPVGTLIDVRVQSALNSGTAAVEDRFEATTVADVTKDEKVVVPTGSVLRGVVSAVDKATRGDRKGSLTLAFDRITVRGKSYDIKSTVTDRIEASTKSEVTKIGGAAAVGAILGGLLAGGKGAAVGAILGGGGMIAATPGTDVDIPAGTVLRIRLDTPLTIQ